MTTDDVLVIGEALIDAVRSDDGLTVEHPGGSPANVAVALSRLDRAVRFATAYGHDLHGDALAAHLASSGVELEGDPRILDHTSVATARLDASGSASYAFDLEWRLGPVHVGSPRWVHVGSISAVLEPGCDAVLDVVRRLPEGTLLSYDVNVRPAITGTGPDVVARVETLAGLAHLVKASDQDLDALYPGVDTVKAAGQLLALGARAVAITRGGDGATWLSEAGQVDVPGKKVQVVDTIGAGDTFSAALVDALWDGFDVDPAAVLDHAISAAAINVSRAGANPPYRSELDAAERR